MTNSRHAQDLPLPRWARENADVAAALEQICKSTLQEITNRRTLQLSSERTSVIYLVLNGWLVVSKSTEDGQRQIVDFVLPGEVFDPASARRRLSAADVTALTRAHVASVPRTQWHDLLHAHPDLQDRMDRHLAAGFARISERLLRVGKAQAETRIAYAICELCLRSTDLGLADGEKFHLPVTQQVLGDFVGLSSVHVSRTLRRLRRGNIVTTGDQLDIVIEDVDRLAEIAEVDLEELRAEIIPAA